MSAIIVWNFYRYYRFMCAILGKSFTQIRPVVRKLHRKQKRENEASGCVKIDYFRFFINFRKSNTNRFDCFLCPPMRSFFWCIQFSEMYFTLLYTDDLRWGFKMSANVVCASRNRIRSVRKGCETWLGAELNALSDGLFTFSFSPLSIHQETIFFSMTHSKTGFS